MSITTYAELKTAVAAWGKRSDLTALVPDFITYAHQEINRTLRAQVMEAAADLTINAETITAPTGFLAVRRLWLDVTPRQRVSVVSAEKRIDLTAELASQTYPLFVSSEGGSLSFAPVFTGTPTGKLLYIKQATAMTTDGSTNAVLAKYPFLYLNGALAALFRYLEDFDQEAKYEQAFRGMIADINASEAKDATSGPIQTLPAFGGIV